MPGTWTTVPIGQVPPNAGFVVGAYTDGHATYLALPPVAEDRPAVLVNGALVASAAHGAVLTCTQGNWLGTPTGYAYQWQSGGTNVGTNSNTYTSVAGDAGKAITCIVTATNSMGSTAAPPSNGVAIT